MLKNMAQKIVKQTISGVSISFAEEFYGEVPKPDHKSPISLMLID